MTLPFVLFACTSGLVGTGCGVLMIQGGHENFFRGIHHMSFLIIDREP